MAPSSQRSDPDRRDAWGADNDAGRRSATVLTLLVVLVLYRRRAKLEYRSFRELFNSVL